MVLRRQETSGLSVVRKLSSKSHMWDWHEPGRNVPEGYSVSATHCAGYFTSRGSTQASRGSSGQDSGRLPREEPSRPLRGPQSGPVVSIAPSPPSIHPPTSLHTSCREGPRVSQPTHWPSPGSRIPLQGPTLPQDFCFSKLRAALGQGGPSLHPLLGRGNVCASGLSRALDEHYRPLGIALHCGRPLWS